MTGVEQAFREQWGKVLASLIGYLGDFELAEEAAQEAFAMPPSTGRATACPAIRAPG